MKYYCHRFSNQSDAISRFGACQVCGFKGYVVIQ